MVDFLLRAEDVLRRRGWAVHAAASRGAVSLLIAQIAAFGAFYGLVMGSFGGVVGERIWTLQAWQMVYAGLKVPLLLAATFLISLPSFFVINTLVGLRRDFATAVRALVASQAALAIVLTSFAPLTIFWYASWSDYNTALLLNAAMFGSASVAAQVLLRGYYVPLIQRDRRHRWMLWTWIFVYAFVGIQMAWILRPFVGYPDAPVQFFRDSALSNAYVVVMQLIADALLGFLGLD